MTNGSNEWRRSWDSNQPCATRGGPGSSQAEIRGTLLLPTSKQECPPYSFPLFVPTSEQECPPYSFPLFVRGFGWSFEGEVAFASSECPLCPFRPSRRGILD